MWSFLWNFSTAPAPSTDGGVRKPGDARAFWDRHTASPLSSFASSQACSSASGRVCTSSSSLRRDTVKAVPVRSPEVPCMSRTAHRCLPCAGSRAAPSVPLSAVLLLSFACHDVSRAAKVGIKSRISPMSCRFVRKVLLCPARNRLLFFPEQRVVLSEVTFCFVCNKLFILGILSDINIFCNFAPGKN